MLDDELVFLSLGLVPILEGKPTTSLERSEYASGTVRRMSRAISKFLAQTEPEAYKGLPDVDYEAVSKLLDETGTEDQVAAFKAVASDPVMAAATRVINVLQQAKSHRVRVGLTGTTKLPPNDMELARFKRMWAIALDPMTVLDALKQGCLSPDMVQVFAAMFPALYEAMKQTVLSVIGDMVTKRPKWQIDTRRERRLKRLMQVPVSSASEAASPSPTPGRGIPPKQDHDELLTAGQKAA